MLGPPIVIVKLWWIKKSWQLCSIQHIVIDKIPGKVRPRRKKQSNFIVISVTDGNKLQLYTVLQLGGWMWHYIVAHLFVAICQPSSEFRDNTSGAFWYTVQENSPKRLPTLNHLARMLGSPVVQEAISRVSSFISRKRVEESRAVFGYKQWIYCSTFDQKFRVANEV